MSLEVNIKVLFHSANEPQQDDIVWSVVKDKLLELRSALQMLSTQQTTYMQPPQVTATKRGEGLAMRINLDEEKHSDEQ